MSSPSNSTLSNNTAPGEHAGDTLWHIKASYGCVGVVLAPVGVLLNILSALVWSRPEMMSTTAMYIITLSGYNAIYLLLRLNDILEILYSSLIGHNDWYHHHVFLPTLKVLLPFGIISNVGSKLTTVALAADRMIGVAFPLKIHSFCTKFKVKVTLALVLLVSSVVSVPYLMVRYFALNRNAAEQEGSTISPFQSGFVSSDFYRVVYRTVLGPVLVSAGSILSMAVFNIIIVMTLRKSRNEVAPITVPATRRSNFGRSPRTVTVQVMLISVFSILDTVVQHTALVVIKEEGCVILRECSRDVFVYVHVINSLFTVFFSYFLFGAKFRNGLSNMLGMCCFKRCE